MKTLYSTLLFLATFQISKGQINLDATMTPPLNSMMIYYDANVPPGFSFSKSGTSNTWDFSTITPVAGQEDTVYFLPPSNFAGSSAFPAATHASYEIGDESVDMINISASSLNYLGFIGDLIGSGTIAPVVANPPATTMNFPYGYGSSTNPSTSYEVFATGAAIGEPTIDSVYYKSSFSLDAFVIAAGNIILPSGTFQALLERRIISAVDTAWIKGSITGNMWVIAPGFPSTNMDSAFYWYTDQSLGHYAHALYDNTGLHDVHYFKSQATTGITNPMNHSAKTSVYPNPAAEFLKVQGLSFSEAAEWSIYNITGQKVLNGNSVPDQLNVRNLSRGTYILKMITETGERHEIRFVKN